MRKNRPMIQVLTSLPARGVVLLLRGYQLVISPLYGQVCRYYPSCSNYALVAVQRHGLTKGSWLAARRLARCHPWAAGGVDDVPAAPAHPHASRHHAATTV